MELQFVRALPENETALTDIAIAGKRYWGYPERWIEIWTPLLTINPDFIAQADVWTTISESEIAGFYALVYSGERATLEHFWISPRLIGQGMGGGLFEHALKRSRKQGCTILEIESDPNAQGFYESMGGKKVGERVGEVDGQPRVLPILEIKL